MAVVAAVIIGAVGAIAAAGITAGTQGAGIAKTRRAEEEARRIAERQERFALLGHQQQVATQRQQAELGRIAQEEAIRSSRLAEKRAARQEARADRQEGRMVRNNAYAQMASWLNANEALANKVANIWRG
jgi:hypothetical protein